MGEEVVAAGLEVSRAPRSARQGWQLDDDDAARVISGGDPPPPVSSVKLVEAEEANIHDGWVAADDRAPAGVEVPHRFLNCAFPRRPVDVNLACDGGRVDDEAHEAERRTQLVAEE